MKDAIKSIQDTKKRIEDDVKLGVTRQWLYQQANAGEIPCPKARKKIPPLPSSRRKGPGYRSRANTARRQV
jgi:hypothetical protein